MENMNYTQAMARLEEIMALVQSGRMDIDELSGVLKEASLLVQFCRTKLFKVDEEVKALLDELSSELAD